MGIRIGECDRALRLKEEECKAELDYMRRLIDEREEVHRREIRELEFEKMKLVRVMREKNDKLASELELNKKEFDSLRWTTRERYYDLGEKEKEIEAWAKKVESRRKRVEEGAKELELKEKKYGGRMKLLESKERLFERRVKEIELKEKRIEGGMQALELKERAFEGQVMEHESKQKHFEGLMKELESEKKEFNEKVKEFESKQKDFEVKQVRENESNQKHFEGKMKELELERKQFEGKAEELSSKQKDFEIKLKELELKEKQVHESREKFEAQMKNFDFKEKHFEGRAGELELREKRVELQEKEVGSKKKQFEGQLKYHEDRKKHHEARMKLLESKEAQFKMQLKELRSKEQQYEGKMKDLEFRRNQHQEQVKELELREAQFKVQLKELESNKKQFETQSKDLEAKQKQYDIRLNLLESEGAKFKMQLKELKSKENQFEGQKKELESKQNRYEEQARELELKEAQVKMQLKELESNKKQFQIQVKDHETKQDQFEGRWRELELKQSQYEEQVKVHLLKETQFEMQLKGLKSKELQFEGQRKDLELIKNQHEKQMKEFELDESQIKVRLMELESNKKQLEQQVKDLGTKQKQFDGQLKGFELKETRCKSLRIPSDEEKLVEKLLEDEYSILAHQVKTEQRHFTDAYSTKNLELLFNLLEKYELICSQVSDALQTSADPTKLVLDTMKGICSPQLGQQLVESETNTVRRTFNLLMDELNKSTPVISFHVKEEAIKLASNWKVDIDVADKDCLEVLDFFKFIATYEIGSSFDENELQRLLYTIVQHCQAQQVLDDIEKLRDNRFCSSQTDGRNLQLLSNEPKFIHSGSLLTLQMSSDPAELVLEILMNPTLPQNRKGNEASFSDESHIFLLEQLMRMSPDIKPRVREEAMKLAIDLKDNMRGSTENPLVVLGFLLLLSIYGLVSYFNKDEVLKLVEVIAQHKLSVELFQTLGFVDKIDDFVKNLVMKRQHTEAVRFICAYKMPDKMQPVNLLRQHTEWVKQISLRRHRKKCTKTKIRATDQEIASLRAALQCISENNIESQDLVNEIKDCILFLEKQKEDIVREAEASSIVDVQQPVEKRPANEAVTTKNLVQQPKEKKHANKAVSENQVEVEGPDSNVVPSDGAFTMNQIKGQQSQLKRCITDAITMDQVQQPQQKKRAIEVFPSNYQLTQWGENNKRRRKAVTRSVRQRAFTPRRRSPPQVEVPTNHCSLPNPIVAGMFGNRKTNVNSLCFCE